MGKETTASRRARYAAKKAGTFVDKRKGPNNTFPPLTIDSLFLKTDYQNYIHLMTTNPISGYLLEATCTNANEGTTHQHYLYRPTPMEMSAIRNKHLARYSRTAGICHHKREQRRRFQCFSHFLNCIHYLRCNKAKSADCEHVAFDANTEQFPRCNGFCANYRKELFKLYNYKHDSTCAQPNCKSWYTRMILPNKRL